MKLKTKNKIKNFSVLKSLENKNVKMMICMLFVCLCTSFIFAAGEGSAPGEDGIGAIKSIFATVYTFFTSGFVKIIALAGLVWIGIKMIMNRGEPQIVKSLIPWALAALLIGSASFFCDLFLGDTFDVESAIGGATSWL